MRKKIPYHQYDVLAIENWLNDIAAQGYKLTELNGNTCTFQPNDGQRVYYRVRYIDGNKDIGDTFWWGDLYVYHSEDPHALPRPNYDEDAKVCAGKQGKPWHIIPSILVTAWYLFDNYDVYQYGDFLLTLAVVLSAALLLLYLGSNLVQWFRANRLWKGDITVTTHPPKKNMQLLSHIALMLAVILALLVIFANA